MKSTYTNYGDKRLFFDVVIDDLFLNLGFNGPLDRKKALFSLTNHFEDGEWLLQRFNRFIWNHIKETALTQEERASLIDEESTILERSAKNLRLLSDDEDNDGGEIGEILLYGIMKKYYGALPVVPKIFYKQNTKDYAKGADSVHIVLDNAGTYTLWLGESKFYNSLDNSRLDKVVSSVKGLLNSEKLKKEFSIVTSLKELDHYIEDVDLRNKIKYDLKDGVSLDEIKKHLHVPILLLHECSLTAGCKTPDSKYWEGLKDHHLQIAQKYMGKQDSKLKDEVWCYDEISFHLLLFPVPRKSDILKHFLKKAKIFNE